MSKRLGKRNGKPIHSNVLRPSRQDDIALAASVEEGFIQVLGFHKQVRGYDLVPPESLNQDLLRWRQMRVRHRRGDFRNTEAELESVKTVAQWTVDWNCTLRNQPYQKLEWGD
jgi:hypothetical protein